MASHLLDEKAIFNIARQIGSPAARSEYLRQACGSDAALLGQVETLLRAYEQQASFLESPPLAGSAPTSDSPLSERLGMQIGPYKLLQQIGEGGMGVVYMAEQEQPLRRRVAIKIIKPGMDSRQVIARFEAERQALSLMDHPNIARVLDGGTTESGRPYFVMELVKGQPITHYCDEKHLTPRQRLELLLPVCQAIQHAHQKGIIHRDIKPSNILVAEYDEKPVPKVIDFGVAKAIGSPLTEKTMFTGFGQIVGTLEYMSPEQAKVNQLDIDTRSDIYSLGVLLYELLAGSTPFDTQRLRSAAFDEMLRIIREEEPPKPSTKMSSSAALPSVAANRSMEPARLSKTVRGELDWIVMKALEKDRNRRYESANGFALDLQRYLSDEPVQACPPSAAYWLRKFARRNKGGLAVGALVLFFLMLLGGGTGWAVRDRAAQEAEIARERDERQAKLAGQLELILAEIEQLLRQQKWADALVAARRASDLATGGDADAEAGGRVKGMIQDLELVRLLDDIRASRSELFEEQQFDYSTTAEQYAAAFRDAGIDLARLSPEEATQRLRSRSTVQTAFIPVLDDWAVCRRVAGEDREAEDVWKVAELLDQDPWRQKVRQALRSKDENALKALAEAPDLARQPAATLTGLAVALRQLGCVDAAAAVLTLAQHQHPADFWVHFDMAQVLISKNPPSLEQAAGYYRAALAVRPRSASAWNNLGTSLKMLDKLDDASTCFQRAIELDSKLFMAYANLGHVWQRQGKLEDAITCYRKAIELNAKNPLVHTNLGGALNQQGKTDDAIACHKKAIEVAPKFAVAHFNLGIALTAQKKFDEAIASYRRAIELNPRFVLAYQRLAAILLSQKTDYDGAIEMIQKVISLQPKLAAPHFNLATIFSYKGQENEAIASYRTAIRLDPTLAQAYERLARLLTTCADLKLRNPQEALEAARKAVELDPKNIDYPTSLGMANYRAENWKAAIESLEKSMELRRGGNGFNWFFLAMAHWQLGDKEAARTWYTQAVQWTDKHQPKNEELRRIQLEASDLIGPEKKTEQKQD
jgi:serine/threonine protein kinase/Tfp pilus assembly protein PilF